MGESNREMVESAPGSVVMPAAELVRYWSMDASIDAFLSFGGLWLYMYCAGLLKAGTSLVNGSASFFC